MNKRKTTKEANIELNRAFYGEDNKEEFERSHFVNNNNHALVLNQEKNKNKKELDI